MGVSVSALMKGLTTMYVPCFTLQDENSDENNKKTKGIIAGQQNNNDVTWKV